MKRAAPAIIIVVSLCFAIADAFLKVYAIKQLPEEGARFSSPIGFALHKNPGIAFDIPVPLSIVILATLVATFFLAKTAIKKWRETPLLSSFAVMILTGALGNMMDRIINNFTTDYIILFQRSAINLSDILIVVGTIFFLRYTERKENR